MRPEPFVASLAPTHMGSLLRRTFLSGILVSIAAAACRSSPREGATEKDTTGKDATEKDALGPLLAPSTLAARMSDVEAGKIAVFYVGPPALFGRGHVPGARKMAPVDSEQGRRALADELARVPVETDIVLYCGCCPYRNCPNVRPASAIARALGRKNAYVLDLPTRFATDWTEKGYPVARS